jgi:hypothetical protein
MVKKHSHKFRVKRYTIFRGLWYVLLMQFIIMIPVLNVYLIEYSSSNRHTDRCDLWEKSFYDWEEVEVK